LKLPNEEFPPPNGFCPPSAKAPNPSKLAFPSVVELVFGYAN